MDSKTNRETEVLNFYGQFLVRRGIINIKQLREALDLMAETNKPIGEWAMESGLLTALEVNRIHFEQRTSDFFFGEIAIQKKLLDECQVQRLLSKQKENSIRLGEALIQLEHLKKSSAVESLLQFHNQNTDFLGNEEVVQAVVEDWLLTYVIEYFPRLVGRVADIQMKMGPPNLWTSSFQFDLQASVDISCYTHTAIGYDASNEQALGIARSMIGTGGVDCDDKRLLETVISELLNFLLIGLEKRAEEEGVDKGSDYDILRRLSHRGFIIPTVTPDGLGSIIIERHTQ